ncbi:MAG: methyltransferase domain-containing protein [Pyrinomonadaceae bacterium]|nr:methyltransferase domain-containing protein [Pyrinomonadaceae bacterium]
MSNVVPPEFSSSAWPTLAKELDSSALSPAARNFVEVIVEHPDLPERLAKMAQVFRKKKPKRDGLMLARAARALAPKDQRVRILTEWLDRLEAPLWHFRIVHDEVRNEVYGRALEHFVKPGMTVFEIGTGTGILAMLAVRAGARHVYTCEVRPDVAAVAREIIKRNGMAERITVIAKDARQIVLGKDLPERADIFVSEIVDDHLLGEQVLSLTEMARERFLKPDAVLLPRRISAMGSLVTGRGHSEKYRMTEAAGFDMTPFNRFTPAMIAAGVGGGDVEPLSDPVPLLSFDLNENYPKEDSHSMRLPIKRAGTAEAVMRWLRLDFGEGIFFENRPPQRSAWEPQLHLLSEPCSVKAGDTVDIDINYDFYRIYVNG